MNPSRMEKRGGKRAFTIEDYIARSPASESSLTNYRRMLGYAERDLGKPLGEATTADIERLKAQLRKQLSGPQRCVLLRSFYKKAGMPDHSSILVLRQRTAQKDPKLILTPDEVTRMIREAVSTRNRAVIGLLWETGARRHEILALDLADVREGLTPDGRKFYSLFFKKMKEMGTEHTTYVIETAKCVEDWLKVHPTKKVPGAALFVNRFGNRMTFDAVNKLVTVAAKRANIGKRVYPHLFRSSRCTYLLRRGVGETQIRKMLGWKPGSAMIARYQALSDTDTYRKTLELNGMAAPEVVDMGKVDVDDLKPVVAIWGKDAKGKDAKGKDSGVPWEHLPVAEQAVQLAAAIVKEQARLPPPAWSDDVAFLRGEIDRLRHEVESLKHKPG